jgi:hypothetical protein
MIFLLAALASGCGALDALERGAPFRPVALGPLLDRPAELRELHAPTPLDVYDDTISAVLVSFEGQGPRLRTGTLREAPPYRGTLRGFLERAVMPGSFRLLEIRAKDGRTLGHLLLRKQGLETYYLDEGGALVANAMPIRNTP